MSVTENFDPVAEVITWLRSQGGRDTDRWASAIEALKIGAEMRFRQAGRLVKENDELRRARDSWHDDFKALCDALVGKTGLSAIEEAHKLRGLHPLSHNALTEG